MTISINDLSLILGIIGGVLGLLSIGIGFFSIWLAWRLYLAGNTVQVKVIELLARVESTTKRTEFTQRDVNQTILNALVSQLGSVSSSVTAAHHRAAQKVKELLLEITGQSTPEQITRTKDRILGELASSFGEVKEEAVKIPTIPTAAPLNPLLQYEGRPLPPRLHSLVKWMDEVKRRDKNAYFGTRHVHQKVFNGDPGIALAIDTGIRIGLLKQVERDNPYTAGGKIKEIILNDDHPLARAILQPNS